MNAARISNWATATPVAAPVPASPTRCSEPMLDANSDAPMMNQTLLRPARK
jgi:hypothetical protein